MISSIRSASFRYMFFIDKVDKIAFVAAVVAVVVVIVVADTVHVVVVHAVIIRSYNVGR